MCKTKKRSDMWKCVWQVNAQFHSDDCYSDIFRQQQSYIVIDSSTWSRPSRSRSPRRRVEATTTSRCRFHQRFFARKSQKSKNYSQAVSIFFALLGYADIKAARKMLVKSTAGHVLRLNFAITLQYDPFRKNGFKFQRVENPLFTSWKDFFMLQQGFLISYL